MKIVKIAHDRLENHQQPHYLFETPVTLKQGQVVLVESMRGKVIGYVAEDSKIIQDGAMQYIATTHNELKWPLRQVIGVVTLFEEGKNIDG